MYMYLMQEKRYEEATAKFNTVLQVMGYRAGTYIVTSLTKLLHIYIHVSSGNPYMHACDLFPLNQTLATVWHCATT